MVIAQSRTERLIDRREELEQNRDDLNRKIEEYRKIQNQFIFAGLLVLFYAAFIHNTELVSGIFADPPLTRVIIILFGSLLLLFSIRYSTSGFLAKLNSINHELDLSVTESGNSEEKAEELFHHHHRELSKYYESNLMQSNRVFHLGVISILVSFIFIILTFYLVYRATNETITTQVIIAVIGALSFILTDFIAAIYMKMHAEIVKSSNEFHNRFVNTHHFYITNYLVSKVKDEHKKDEGLINLALGITNLGFLKSSSVSDETLLNDSLLTQPETNKSTTQDENLEENKPN